MMKRWVLTFFMCFAAASGFAQEYTQQLLSGLGISDDKITKLLAIQDERQAAMMKAGAQLNLATAQLSALLVDPNVSAAEVEKAVRAAMEWDVQIKLAQIQRELSIRRLIGDAKWRQVNERLRAQVSMTGGAALNDSGQPGTAGGPPAGTPESPKEQRIRALLQELVRLLDSPGS